MTTAKDVAKYFIWLDSKEVSDGVSNLTLQKLVYYSQGYFLALFERPLFPESIAAWRHGPVVPDLWHEFKKFERAAIPPNDDYEPNLSEDEKNLVQEIFGAYGVYSGSKLLKMTQEEQPWLDHHENRAIIPHADLKTFFKSKAIISTTL